MESSRGCLRHRLNCLPEPGSLQTVFASHFSALRSRSGGVPGGRSRRTGGARSELMRVGKCGSHHRYFGNYWAWRVGKIKVFWFLEPVESLGGWWHGKEERARAASSVHSFFQVAGAPSELQQRMARSVARRNTCGLCLPPSLQYSAYNTPHSNSNVLDS